METERLYLREIQEEDAELIVRWRSDPDVYKFFKLPHKVTLEEHLNWFRNIYPSNHNRTDYMCIEKAIGQKIGVFGLVFDGDKVEVNYLLAPEAQHRGFASEAICGLIETAKEEQSIKKAIAEIHKDNSASISLAEKLGFSLETMGRDFVIYGKKL